MSDAREVPPAAAHAPLADHAAGVGQVLALSIAAPAFFAALLFAAGRPLSPVALLLTVALVLWWATRHHARDVRWHVGGAALVVAVSLVVAAGVFDMSFDGQTYHQVAIRALADGWNPVWQPRSAESMSGGRYVSSLPKAAWVLEALVLQATGHLESAKGVNFVALTAAFLVGWPALEAIGVRRRAAIATAALAAANPVSVSQLFTFHLDGLMASAFTIVVAQGVLFARTRAPHWAIGAVFTFAFLANLKFPAAVYAALLGATALVLVAWRARAALRTALLVLAAAGSAALLEGINPFVTNTVLHGHPAYPAAGRNALKLAVHFDPVFAAQPRHVQVARSLLSQSSDNDAQPPRLKVPLSLHAEEFSAFTTVDTRIGGWGPLFGGALLLAWATLAVSLVARVKRAPALTICSVGVCASTLAIPFGHYSRYTPHLWLAAVVVLLLDDLRGPATRLLAVILCANLVLVGGIANGSLLLHDRVHRTQLRTLARDAAGREVTVAQFGPFVNVDLHLRDYGIAYQFADTLACARPARLLKTHAHVCLPDGQSPQPEPVPLRMLESSLRTLLGR
ncbi:MAG: hypothetical protein P3B98_04050 [Gemmatimonadota bacterium]|nr:hypothetical protein [Gemmatimonadota bacterium]